MKLIEYQKDGQTFRVRAQMVGTTLWLHDQGNTFAIPCEKKSSRSRGTGAGAVASGQISAPMPGKIIKLCAQVGDSVNKGDVLVVLEAMKMEYSLAADLAGEVIEVSASKDEQVSLGQLLVKVKAGDES